MQLSRQFTHTLATLVLLPLVSFAQDLSARMDKVVESYVPGQFMGAVLIARGNEVLLSKGYGAANLELDVPNTPKTKFRLGSITKQFTAASILLLEERGKLKIDDPVKKYLSDAPAAWDKITIFNLLTHTSGIPSFTDFPDYASTEPFSTTPEQLVARFRDKPLEFEPGAGWNYSNSGYVLLGYLIEKLSGQTYEKFVQENIFGPLVMKDSGYDSNSAIIARRAAGYSPGPRGPENAGFINMTIPHAGGALYSTTEDLLRWEQALFGGKILSAASVQKMTKPFKEDYGFGLHVETVKGRKVISHGGGIEGFNTFLAYYPDSRITVVVLANLNGPADNIGVQLGGLANGDTVQLPSERKEITLSRQILTQYIGTYELQRGVNMMITLEGDRLMGQLSGQSKLPLFAESETRFFLKAVDAQLEFAKDSSNKVTSVTLHQGGRDTNARRISDSVRERKEVAVSPSILQQYVGTYALQPGLDIVVTVEGTQLVTQGTGQNKIPVFAESETVFFAKVMDAQLEFVKDATGKVTHLVLHQGPANMRAPRR